MKCNALYIDNESFVTFTFYDVKAKTYPDDLVANLNIYDQSGVLVAGPYLFEYVEGDTPEEGQYQATIPADITTPEPYTFVGDGRLYELRATTTPKKYTASEHVSATRRMWESDRNSC